MVNNPSPSTTPASSEIAARCHEIQTGLGTADVPDFDTLIKVGMAVRLALHIQGLPAVSFEKLKLVASYYLKLPSVAMRGICELLAEVEFVKLQTEGSTIKTVVPNVPYYETLYSGLGDYAQSAGFNESEQLSIDLLCRLSKGPEKFDSLKSKVGAEPKLIDRTFQLGKEGSYLRLHRSRGRDIALTPTYFSENAELFADMVASSKDGASVKRILAAVKGMQGVPLSLIKTSKEIGGIALSPEELNLVIRLAQDGAVKPPSIETTHSGKQFFLFTPTPSGAALAPTKRDIYERAMALVAAVRQGQFLAKNFRIRSPAAILYRLKENMKLAKANTEAAQQYRQLVILRVARLIDQGGGFSQLTIIDTPENREALKIAYDLISAGVSTGTEIDESAREALQQEQTYVESLVAAGELRKREPVKLTEEQQLEMEGLFQG